MFTTFTFILSCYEKLREEISTHNVTRQKGGVSPWFTDYLSRTVWKPQCCLSKPQSTHEKKKVHNNSYLHIFHNPATSGGWQRKREESVRQFGNLIRLLYVTDSWHGQLCGGLINREKGTGRAQVNLVFNLLWFIFIYIYFGESCFETQSMRWRRKSFLLHIDKQGTYLTA